MWLAIDIGNTNIHIGVFEGNALQSTHSVKHEFPHLHQVHFIKTLNPDILKKAQAIIYSSVNPKVEAFVIEYIRKHLTVKPQSIGKDIPIPVSVLTQHPEKVGVDRLVNALAAFEMTKNRTIVVDAGTAITIDVISDKGAFLGGIISPGIGMSLKALHHFTALLPEISIDKPGRVLGKNTEEAIQSGVYWGTIGMVSRIITMLCDELGCQPTIIATGGNAKILAREIPLITSVIPFLTLEGIKIAYKTNPSSKGKH